MVVSLVVVVIVMVFVIMVEAVVVKMMFMIVGLVVEFTMALDLVVVLWWLWVLWRG